MHFSLVFFSFEESCPYFLHIVPADWDGGGKTKIDEKKKMHIWPCGAVHVS